MKETIITCRICGQAQNVEPMPDGTTLECVRCGSVLLKQKRDSIGRTAAFSLAALILYVPANIYPILQMDYHGAHSESTVWDGCVRLFESGQWLIAIIVFCASILIPLLKLLGLFFLVTTVKSKSAFLRRERTAIYRIIEIIGPWAMLDVFLLAVLVGLVKVGQLATVLPGPGIVAFAAVVVFTILASASFDPKLIWEPSQ